MKLISSLLFASLALAQNAAFGQSHAHPKPAAHAAAATHTAAGACVKLPELGPKFPALPAGTPCAKALYTITTVPTVKLDYVSPQEGPALNEFLGIGASSFSLAYIDTKVGTGELAAPHKYYDIQYTGYLVDGTKFDSSHDHGTEPFNFQIGQHQVIAGWDTGFAGMRVGGKRRIFIPFQLAYGPQGRPPTIPAKAELIFDLEFIGQSDKAPELKTPQPPAAKMAPPVTRPASPPPPTPPAATPPAAAPPKAQ